MLQLARENFSELSEIIKYITLGNIFSKISNNEVSFWVLKTSFYDMLNSKTKLETLEFNIL